VLKKKIWANFQRIIELFTKKMVKKLIKIWSWDPGSEIRDPEKTYSGSRIPDPGVKKAPDPRIPDPQHWVRIVLCANYNDLTEPIFKHLNILLLDAYGREEMLSSILLSETTTFLMSHLPEHL
jgi:hypothetical protein